MKKNIKFILIALILVAILSVSLVGCAPTINLSGGDPTATTYNNNSLVVRQGEYIYFVNGKIILDDITSKKDNKYGNVQKGAIYRAKLDGSNAEVVVPQLAMDSNNANGISVLGGYIYFTSPSVTTAKDGSLKKDNTDFYRVEISGKNLKKLVTLEGNTNQYKFTESGLIYLSENNLTYLPYEGKNKVVVENVSNSYFPVTSTYTPGKANATMAVYYTESPEENTGNPYNDIKCITSTGEIKTILSGKDIEATYSLKSVETEANGEATLYYEKTLYEKGSNANQGLFGIKVTSAYAKTQDAEKQFAAASATVRYINFAEGAYTFEDNEMFIPEFDSAGLVSGKKVSYSLRTSDSASISNTDIFMIREEGENNKKYMYFFDTDSLVKVEMFANSFGIAETVIEANIVIDYVKPIVDGNTFYYINSSLYNYIYKVDVVEKDAKHSIFGVRTAADKESYIKYVKDLDEDARAEHDKLIKEDLKAEELAND